MNIGDKVLLKKSYAKWHLDHPEIYECAGHWDDCYESDTILHLMCCMDVPVQGCINNIHRWMPPDGTTYQVTFRVGKLKMSYWVERRNIERINS